MTAPGPDKLLRTVQDLMDAEADRPKPSAAFLRAVANYVEASRRLAAAQRALLAQVDTFEMAVRAARGEPDDAPVDPVPSPGGRTTRRATRGMSAVCGTPPGHWTAQRPRRQDRRG